MKVGNFFLSLHRNYMKIRNINISKFATVILISIILIVVLASFVSKELFEPNKVVIVKTELECKLTIETYTSNGYKLLKLEIYQDKLKPDNSNYNSTIRVTNHFMLVFE